MPKGDDLVGRTIGIRVASSFKESQMPSNDIPSDQFSEPKEYTDLLSTPEKLDQVATIVAQGEFPFPTGLVFDQIEQLADEVRKRRRRRLVKFIARSIAQEIWRSIEQDD